MNKLLLSSLASVTLLSACGGTGGAPTGTGNTNTVQPPPQSAYIPAPGAAVGSNAAGHPLTKVLVTPSTQEVELLHLINEVRTKGTLNGVQAKNCVPAALAGGPLKPLSYSGVLAHSARMHALYMGNVGYLAHEEKDPDTEHDAANTYFYAATVHQRLAKSLDYAELPSSYDFIAGNSGENVAGGTPGSTTNGYETAAQVMAAWVDSTTGHCENLMDPDWAYMGTGYFLNTTPNADQNQYPRLHKNNWVQVFSKGVPDVKYTFSY